MSSRIRSWGIIIIGMFIVLSSCSKKSPYPEDVALALDKAGDNRPELEKAITYFSAWDDTLKLKAIFYLIGNMENHSYAVFGLFDTLGNKIEFDASRYPDFDEVVSVADSLEESYGPLDFTKDTLYYDVQSISADVLINQVDFAFRAWRTKPWSKELSFEYFLEYVLPFRGSNEPIEPWREYFFQKYSGLDTVFNDTTSAIEVASYLNNDIKSWFTFDRRYYYHPTDQGLSQMLENHYGRCEDMANLAIYAMRSVGLAVTSDYTPYWANAGGNHAWNALILPDGDVIPFMGCESNPGQYGLPNKMAKVYRKMYSLQRENLIFKDRKQEKVPGWLAGKSYIDVTEAYTEVCDVVYRFDRAIPDSVDFAYLCVFNSGDWQAVHWGKIIGDAASFDDMGTGIVYLPALYLNEEIKPFGAPFILHEDCTLEKLQANQTTLIEISIGSVTGFKAEIATDGVHRRKIEPGMTYELFYWSDGWERLSVQESKSGIFSFDNVPEGGLYWLKAENSDNDERIFSLDDNQSVWW